MHKDFYASGFLYRPSTGQILLQQPKSNSDIQSPWSMFEMENLQAENAGATFRRIIQKLLHVKLNVDSIDPVYEYFCKDKNKTYQIIYAELEDINDFSPKNGTKFAWFSFKQTLRLPLTEQARHDIVIGERVIDSKERKSLGQQT